MSLETLLLKYCKEEVDLFNEDYNELTEEGNAAVFRLYEDVVYNDLETVDELPDGEVKTLLKVLGFKYLSEDHFDKIIEEILMEA